MRGIKSDFQYKISNIDSSTPKIFEKFSINKTKNKICYGFQNKLYVINANENSKETPNSIEIPLDIKYGEVITICWIKDDVFAAGFSSGFVKLIKNDGIDLFGKMYHSSSVKYIYVDEGMTGEYLSILWVLYESGFLVAVSMMLLKKIYLSFTSA